MKILKTNARLNVLACGRRFGKSLLGLQLIADVALTGAPTHWAAPTYKILGDAWRDCKDLLMPVISRVSEQDKRIELVTGGTIEFWTLDGADPMRSRKGKRVFIDEAGMCSELETQWNNAIRPVLTDLEGDAFFAGTPKGRNYFWQLFAKGQDELQKEWSSWQMPSSTNPFLNPDEIEAARLEMPDRSFRQEYQAEFIADSGGVFRGVANVIVHGAKTLPVVGACFMGVDLARVEDFTVLTVVDENGSQVYFERFNQISWERQVERIVDVTKMFGVTKVFLDSTGIGDPIYEQVRRKGVPAEPYKFTNESKERLIDNLAMMIEGSRVRLLDITVQQNELESYEYEVTKAGNTRMNAPSGMHDDTVIALALACWPLRVKKKALLVGF